MFMWVFMKLKMKVVKSSKDFLTRAVMPGMASSTSGFEMTSKSESSCSSAKAVSFAIVVAPRPRFGTLMMRMRLTVSSGL